jgi:hypothetical protein
MRVDNPIQILFTLFAATRPAMDGSEQRRAPFDALVRSLGGLFTLLIFNCRLSVSSGILIPSPNGICHTLPELLRLAFALILERSNRRSSLSRMGGIKQQLSLIGLWECQSNPNFESQMRGGYVLQDL